MLPTKLNPLGVNPYDGVMEFEKAGRNLLNPNYLGGSKTSNGVTFSYIPEEDVFCLNGTAGNASQSTQFLTWYPYTLKLDKTAKYRLSIQIVSGEASFVDTGARVLYFGNGDEPKTANNWINVNIKESGSDYNPVNRVSEYDYLTRIWIYQIKPGDSFDNYKFRVQLEKGETVTEYEPYNENLYRCYGESTQYQNDGRNLLPLPDLEEYTSWGVSTSIKNGRVKMKGTPKGASPMLKLTNGYGKHQDSEYKGHYNNETFLPAGTYTISFQNISGTYPTSGSYPCISLKSATDSNVCNTVALWRNKLTVTCSEPVAYALLATGTNYDIDVEFDLQIEAGSTVTDYMPYTDSPTPTEDNPSPIMSNYPKGRYKTNLPGITIKLDDDLRSAPKTDSDYAKDYIEVDIGTKDKYIIRECNKHTITGDENITYDTYYKVGIVNESIPKGVQYNNMNTMLNTHKLGIRWSNSSYNTVQVGGMTGVDSNDTCKSYFKTRYDKGTPVTFVYALAEPITTQL